MRTRSGSSCSSSQRGALGADEAVAEDVLARRRGSRRPARRRARSPARRWPRTAGRCETPCGGRWTTSARHHTRRRAAVHYLGFGADQRPVEPACRRAYTAAAVSKGKREAIADWLMLLGAPILLGSLFLTWSHQFSRGVPGPVRELAGAAGRPARSRRLAAVLGRRRAAGAAGGRAAGGGAARHPERPAGAACSALAVALAFTCTRCGARRPTAPTSSTPRSARYAADCARRPGARARSVALGAALRRSAGWRGRAAGRSRPTEPSAGAGGTTPASYPRRRCP